jgi:hypothetical protein
MRICPFADWKKQLNNFNESTFFISNYQNNDYNKLPCTNGLQFGTSIDKLEILAFDQSKFKVVVNIYERYLQEILSDCVDLEILLKYSVLYRKINNQNGPSELQYQKVYC